LRNLPSEGDTICTVIIPESRRDGALACLSSLISHVAKQNEICKKEDTAITPNHLSVLVEERIQ
jgi:hypothetical protein